MASRSLHASAQPSLAVLRPKFWGPPCGLPPLFPTIGPESLILCFLSWDYSLILMEHILSELRERGCEGVGFHHRGCEFCMSLLLHLTFWLGVAL